MRAFVLSPEAERDLDVIKGYLLDETGDVEKILERSHQ